ncbi:DUF1080 domain-containing protein [Compostibacter hankyongensis]|uniref:DUF1080 domain-containing protein n=1 Tax=Compostibacter hankyongensis TaxID=1007089 RepID=A0ABP8FK78_9BACT
MKKFFVIGLCCVCVTAGLLVSSFKPGKTVPDEDGFARIFDGKTLKGWEGDSTYWHVENGEIVGVVTPATLLKRNTFLIWRGGAPGDFELKLEYRITQDGNSGINYRSVPVEGLSYALKGYQEDIDGRNVYTGQNYEERGRCILAYPGQQVVLPPVKESLAALVRQNAWTASQVTASLGKGDALKSYIRPGWNECHIIAEGNHLRHYVNGVLMSEVTDNDPEHRRSSGLLGVQVHVGPPMKVEYRNIRLKRLD